MRFLTTLFITALATLFSVAAAPARAPAPCPLAHSSSATLESTSSDTYALTFAWQDRSIPVDYVDMHYRVNDGEFVNVRAYDGTTPATEATHPIKLHAGDVLHAMVTYSSNGVGCDVAISQHRGVPSRSTPSVATTTVAAAAPTSRVASSEPSLAAPAPAITTHTTSAAPISCAAVQQQLVHDGQGYNIHAILPEGSTFGEVHYNVNGISPVNQRLIASPTHDGVMTLASPIIASVNDQIRYFLTFGSATAPQCDTATYASGAAEPEVAAPARTTARAPARYTPAAMPAPAPAAATPIYADTPAPAPAPAPAAADMAPAPSPTAVIAPTPIAATVDAEAASPGAPSVDPACAAGQIEHRVARDDNGDMIVQFNAINGDAPFDKVEMYTLVGDAEANTPMGTNIAAGQSAPLHVADGQSLTYYITYSRHGAECKTEFFST